KYIFEAYSKDFSQKHPKLRLGRATIRKITNAKLDTIAEALLTTRHISDQSTEILGEHRYREMEGLKTDDGVKTEVFYKLGEKDGSVYQLEVCAIGEAVNDQWPETFI